MSIRACWYHVVIAVVIGMFCWENALFSVTILLILVTEPYLDTPHNKWHITFFHGTSFGLGMTLPSIICGFSARTVPSYLMMFFLYTTISIAGLSVLAQVLTKGVIVGEKEEEDEEYDELW